MTEDSKPTEPDFSGVTTGASSTAPETAAKPRTYTVVSGDTLSKIARHFYGKASEWNRIFAANKDTITNPDLIKVGQVLTIPE